MEGIGLVKAFEATYKAACRLYRTAPSDVILGKLEELAEEGKPLEKVRRRPCRCATSVAMVMTQHGSNMA